MEQCQKKIDRDEFYFPIKNVDGSYNNSDIAIKKKNFDGAIEFYNQAKDMKNNRAGRNFIST